jgi:predicted YcjX-like family ATPase
MDWLLDLRIKGQRLKARALGQHLRIGITGLSGAGKTAFITSLINQLLNPNAAPKLPFFTVMPNRYFGAKLLESETSDCPRFPYEQNLAAIQAKTWPVSTTGWSQISLMLRYQSTDFLAGKLKNYSELQLDIVDYPGEWLLDLPMLQQEYDRWCQQMWLLLDQPERADLVAPFKAQLANVDLQNADDWSLQQLSDAYAQLLQGLRTQHAAVLLQPGRLLLPAELAGTPLLWLFPLLPKQLNADTPLYVRLKRQFVNYQQRVIKPFYQDYFAGLDRQVVLVDCLGALNQGFAVMQETQQALMQILQSFRYGPTSFLGRLFQPKIDKILFAATKADLLTPEQHRNLTLLLQQMLQQPLQDSRYQRTQTEALALSAVVTSEFGVVETPEGSQPCIRGTDRNGQLRTLFPGDVPISMPSQLLFSHHQFAFPQFVPQGLAVDGLLPSQRLDQALEFIIGDALQ